MKIFKWGEGKFDYLSDARKLGLVSKRTLFRLVFDFMLMSTNHPL